MSAMVNDLLEYSRIQLGGAMPLKLRATDLREVAVAALHDAGATHPDCPFELESAGDLNGDLDAVRIQQLMTNLLTNAAQYRDKHYRVTLSLSGGPDQLVLLVKNRGPVIPASALEAIFNPMVQLAQPEEPSGRPTTSMGLGLFIAREVVQAHGGTIAVSSTVKEGTIFTVTLPRTRHG
jgi:signal transduction histidine kinase